jgi:hypothetical protein
VIGGERGRNRSRLTKDCKGSVGGGTSFLGPATYTMGKQKWHSDAADHDPCQGSCAACHIECRGQFTTVVILHIRSLPVGLRPRS